MIATMSVQKAKSSMYVTIRTTPFTRGGFRPPLWCPFRATWTAFHSNGFCQILQLPLWPPRSKSPGVRF